MEALRGRGAAASPRGREELPLTHAKAWRQGRPPARQTWHSPHAQRGRAAARLVQRSVLALVALLVAARVGAYLLRGPQPELADLVRLDGDGAGAAAAAWRGDGAERQPKLIPRLIHQAHADGEVAPHLHQYMASWRRLNPGWEVRLYSEQDCLEFVRREFPEYLQPYRRLEEAVERSDFFRYMVVLRHGGVYADPAAECRRPLDGLLHSQDTLVAGWDTQFADAEAALAAGHVRLRQLVQWVFAGAPGHPALRELCDGIAAAVAARRSFSADARTDALERTGAGAFTDVLLRHAAAHPPARHDDPWGVRLLPRVRFGAPTAAPAHGLAPDDPGVAALHHGGGGAARWQGRRGWPWRATVRGVTSEVARRWAHRSEDARAELGKVMAARAAEAPLLPVSVDWDPPFDLLAHGAGRGERQSGADVGAAIATHGSWQPSVAPSRRPSLLDALVGGMGGAGSRRNVLIDVGAGYGLLSLAAAARGHRVHAFELGPRSLEALEASVQRNGMEHLVQVHKVPLGSPQQEGYTCILPKQGSGGAAAAAAADDVEVQRGYGPAGVHALPAEGCQLMTRRATGSAAVPEAEHVAALRVSANGWEGFVLQGFAPLLERADRPPVVALEWNPAAMRAAGWRRPLQLVEWLHGLGYRDISHSGYVCDQRWYSITYGIRRRGGVRPEDLAGLRQPTWCRLLPDHFSLLLDRASGAYPETLLLINRAAAVANGSAAATGPGIEAGLGAGGADEYGVPDVVAQALAEAALMVADPAANRTAAAVSDLAAGEGDAGGMAPASQLARDAATQWQRARKRQAQQQQQSRQRRGEGPPDKG